MGASAPRPDRDAESRALLRAAQVALASSRVTAARSAALEAYRRTDASAAARADAGLLLCQLHYRLGELRELADAGALVQQLLADVGRDPERFELMRWVTLACCEIGRFEQALLSASENLACAQAPGVRSAEHVLALNAMGACFERMGDPWQAERLFGDALAIAAREDLRQERLVTLNNLTAMLIGLYLVLRDGGDADEPRAALQRALIHAERARELALVTDDPFLRTVVDGNLAEVLMHLGRFSQAQVLLDAALDRARGYELRAQAWHIRCTLGELRLARGDALHAVDEFDALLGELGGAGSSATELRLHRALHRACRDVGSTERALHHLERARQLEHRRAVQQLKAQSRHLVTKLEAEHARSLAERHRSRADRYEAFAHRDPLTGLVNRRGLERSVDALRSRAAEGEFDHAVAMLDLDHFKRLNDEYGHAAGDAVLASLANLLRVHLRPGDVLARVGGEEFALIAADLGPAQFAEVAARLRDAVAQHRWPIEGLRMTLSIGTSGTHVGHGDDPRIEQLLEHADAALYRAKRGGRNRVIVAADAASDVGATTAANATTAGDARTTGDATTAGDASSS
jgi:diguanylate cyclase (GGDEF)-like protein